MLYMWFHKEIANCNQPILPWTLDVIIASCSVPHCRESVWTDAFIIAVLILHCYKVSVELRCFLHAKFENVRFPTPSYRWDCIKHVRRWNVNIWRTHAALQRCRQRTKFAMAVLGVGWHRPQFSARPPIFGDTNCSIQKVINQGINELDVTLKFPQ